MKVGPRNGSGFRLKAVGALGFLVYCSSAKARDKFLAMWNDPAHYDAWR